MNALAIDDTATAINDAKRAGLSMVGRIRSALDLATLRRTVGAILAAAGLALSPVVEAEALAPATAGIEFDARGNPLSADPEDERTAARSAAQPEMILLSATQKTAPAATAQTLGYAARMALLATPMIQTQENTALAQTPAAVFNLSTERFNNSLTGRDIVLNNVSEEVRASAVTSKLRFDKADLQGAPTSFSFNQPSSLANGGMFYAPQNAGMTFRAA